MLPSTKDAQGNRAKALLEWANGPTGVGLQTVLEILEDFDITLPE